MELDQFKKTYTQSLKSNSSTIIEVITSREENLRMHQALNRAILDKVSS